jgi:hypothetical protein
VPTQHAPTVTIEDFARRMVGSDEMTDEQLKQIREQQEVENKHIRTIIFQFASTK